MPEQSELDRIIDAHVEKFFTRFSVKTEEILSSIKALQQQGVYKQESFRLNNGQQSFFRNDTHASAILIVPGPNNDLTNLTVGADGFNYVFPAGTTSPKIITILLPNQEVILTSSVDNLLFTIFSLTKQSAEIFSSLDVNSVTIANNPSVNILGQPISTTNHTPPLELLASTTTPLAASAVYNSGSLNVDGSNLLTGSVYSDQAGSLAIQQSSDNTNWDIVDTIAVSAATGVAINQQIYTPYARIVYTNGATAQTVFRLYVWANQ